jgi:Zn-dependent protease with chaperone function
LIRVTPGIDYEWEFIVVDDPMVNAACLPGGKVIFFKGLMDLLGNDDAQIASVMSHEIAHALLRHHMESRGFYSVLGSVAFVVRNILGIRIGGDRVLLNMGVLLPFSRKHEREADLVGLFLMARACYNPNRAPVTFQKMSQKKGSVNSYFSTHPSDKERIELLKKNIPAAEQERMYFCASGVKEHIDVWHQGLYGKFKF